MKHAVELLRNAPPYLTFLVAFAGAVAWGLVRLLGMLQAMGVQA